MIMAIRKKYILEGEKQTTSWCVIPENLHTEGIENLVQGRVLPDQTVKRVTGRFSYDSFR